MLGYCSLDVFQQCSGELVEKTKKNNFLKKRSRTLNTCRLLSSSFRIGLAVFSLVHNFVGF